MVNSPNNKLMWHVFIQWLTHNDILDEWLSLTVLWYDNHDTAYGLSGVGESYPMDFCDTFEWDDEWVQVNDEWVEFYELNLEENEYV